MKVLFIGGTGIISTACAARAISIGIDLTLFNRGISTRPVPEGARVVQGNFHDPDSIRAALTGQHFDAVVDWIAYTPDDVQRDIDLFKGKTGQYVFISSASAYHKPVVNLPITESTQMYNPFWQYSRDKIACEKLIMQENQQTGFPYTIVRPSHTYDQTSLPVMGGYTTVARMLQGKAVIVPGDGTSLWTLTHSRDFAVGFAGLLGNSRALNEVFHITSDEWLPWNEIYLALAEAAGVKPQLVHVASDLIAAYDSRIGDSLLGDKSHSVIFDNSKIKRLVPEFNATIPFAQGAREIITWHAADPARQVVDEGFNALCDRLLENYRKAWPDSREVN